MCKFATTRDGVIICTHMKNIVVIQGFTCNKHCLVVKGECCILKEE